MDKNTYSGGLNSALWQKPSDVRRRSVVDKIQGGEAMKDTDTISLMEFRFRGVVLLFLGMLIGALLASTGCLTASVLRPSARSLGVATAAAYFETEAVPHSDLQNVRKAAKISYHALKLVTAGEQSGDEALIVKAMEKMGIESPGLKQLALEFYRESELKLNLRFPSGLTSKIIEEFKEGIDAGIATYKTGPS